MAKLQGPTMIAGEIVVGEDKEIAAGGLSLFDLVNDAVDRALAKFSAEHGGGGTEGTFMRTAARGLNGVEDEV